MILTLDTLRRAAQAYGSSTALAQALGIHPATMRRWIAGTSSWEPCHTPGWLERELARVMAGRAEQLRLGAAEAATDMLNRAITCKQIADEIGGAWCGQKTHRKPLQLT